MVCWDNLLSLVSVLLVGLVSIFVVRMLEEMVKFVKKFMVDCMIICVINYFWLSFKICFFKWVIDG